MANDESIGLYEMTRAFAGSEKGSRVALSVSVGRELVAAGVARQVGDRKAALAALRRERKGVESDGG